MTEALRPLERRESTTDEQLIPPAAILIEQQDGLAVRARPSCRARRLNLHQGHEAVDFRLSRCEFCEDAAETQRVFTQRRSHPVVTGGRRISLIEDQIHDLEY